MSEEIIVTEVELAAGEEAHFPGYGAEEINIRTIAGGSEISIALDDGSWLPISAGEGFVIRHEGFKVKNTNLVAVKVTVFQSTQPRTYYDRRDTATSVSIGGTFSVINSPYVDEGGSLHKFGASLYNAQHDTTATAAVDVTIVPAASNINGLVVRRVDFLVFTASSGISYLRSFPPYGHILHTHSQVGTFVMTEEYYQPPGADLTLHVEVGQVLRATVSYDIL